MTLAEAQEVERAIEALAESRPPRADAPVEFAALLADAWDNLIAGEVEDALTKLQRARALSEGDTFDDGDRAEVLFRLGACRLHLGAVSNAVQLLTVALELCDRSGRPCDRLRNDILRWRTRSYRRQRDWDGARADAAAALTLAEGFDDPRRLADSYLQASQVAERTGQLIVARFYVEHAVEILRRAAESPACNGQTLNLGVQAPEIPIRELAELVLDVVGKRLRIVGAPDAPGSPPRRCPDMRRTTELTSYEPRVPLREGVERTYAWYRANVFAGTGVFSH